MKTGAPLDESHRATLPKHEIAPQRINDHEDDLVERRMRLEIIGSSRITAILPTCKAWQYRLVGKETSCKYQDSDRDQEVRKCEACHA
jgi:hypothetical protein